MKLNRVMLSVLAGLALIAALPVRADDKPVTLTRTYKKGDVTRLKAESAVTTANGDVQAVMTSKFTVKDVKDNGQVVVEQAGEGGKVTIGGNDMDIPASPPVTVTRDKSGKLVEFKMDESTPGLSTPEISRLMATIGPPILQDKEVKPGDTWQTEMDNPAAKGKKVIIKTTFVGIDKVDGTDHWKVKQTAEPDTDANGGKMNYEATYWLDPANGQEVKSEANVKDLPSQYGLLTMKIKTTRLKEDAK